MIKNIVLHILDIYLLKIEENFNKGLKRRQNPEYFRIKHLRNKAIHTGTNSTEINSLRKELFQVPKVDYFDPHFRRIMYVRYADDFVIFIEGTIHEATHIRNNIREFLKAHCGLDLNVEKTTISNLSDNKLIFLGAQIVKPIRGTYLSKIGNIRHRPHLKLLLKAPMDKLLKELALAGFVRRSGTGKYVAQAYTPITNLSHHEIINFFNAKIRGLLNLYSSVSNYNRLRSIMNFLLLSCAYTLARKLKLQPYTKTFKLFGKKLACPNTKVELALPKTMKSFTSLQIYSK
jgi:hypothetical protein